MKKFFCYFFGTIFVFLLGLMLYLAKFADEPLDDFSDLEPSLTEVPPEENGFQTIIAILDTLEVSSNFDEVRAIEDFTAEDKELFQKFYISNKIEFESLHKAIESEFIQEPINNDIAQEYKVMQFLVISKLLSHEIKLHLANNEIEKAVIALHSQTQLGKKCLRSDGTMLHHMVAIAIISYALESQYTLITQTKNFPTLLIDTPRLNKDINDSFQMSMDLEWAIHSESIDMLYMNASIPKLSQNSILRAFIYQPNKTLNSLAQMTRLSKRIHAANLLNKQAIIDELNLSLPTSAPGLSSNYIGEDLLYNEGRIANLSFQYDPLILKNRAIHLLVALQSYSNDHDKELPESLTDLIPKYIATIPLDPFSEKPLHYSKKKKLIWSVGSDLIENHGISVKTLDPDEKNPLKTLEFEDEPHLTIPF